MVRWRWLRWAAALPLHVGRLLAFLDETGLIENANAVPRPVPRRHQLLTMVPHDSCQRPEQSS